MYAYRKCITEVIKQKLHSTPSTDTDAIFLLLNLFLLYLIELKNVNIGIQFSVIYNYGNVFIQKIQYI